MVTKMLNDMWFNKFRKTCDKYEINFTLNNHDGLKLSLNPRNTHNTFWLTEDQSSKNIFKRAIEEIKKYYNTCE